MMMMMMVMIMIMMMTVIDLLVIVVRDLFSTSADPILELASLYSGERNRSHRNRRILCLNHSLSSAKKAMKASFEYPCTPTSPPLSFPLCDQLYVHMKALVA